MKCRSHCCCFCVFNWWLLVTQIWIWHSQTLNFNGCNIVTINYECCVVFPKQLANTAFSVYEKLPGYIVVLSREEPNGLGYWTYATDFHGNKCGAVCNQVSCSANRQCFPLLHQCSAFQQKKHHSIRQSLRAKSILESRRRYWHGPVFIRLAISKGGHADIIQT